ncbi:High mobility group [Coemansia spiralis]|uniref:High mobility group n=1 Tax=Coemansia spiralis TaxID=417178 RepID=A0A9W8L783_9FUNG|nr:High mobility group [Coemansia spiralis]
MVTKPASGNASATFAKLSEAYESLALIHSRISGRPIPAKKQVVKRDPNEPKRPPSAYILYTHDKRQEIKDSRPDVAPAELLALTVEAWNNISNEERKRYDGRAAEIKKAYVEEMAKYKAEHGIPVAESEEEVPAAPAPAKATKPKKAKEAPAKEAPVQAAVDLEEPKKKNEPTTNGAAPEKRKKKSSSPTSEAAPPSAGKEVEHHDSEKKKKKKKSHKSKHSESH